MGIPVGPVRVYGYLPVDEKLEDIRQRTLESLWYLGRITPLPEPEFRNIADQDWMVAWKKKLPPHSYREKAAHLARLDGTV